MPHAEPPVLYDPSGTPIPQTGEPPEYGYRLPLSLTEDRHRGYPSRDQRPSHLSRVLEDADAGDPRQLFEFIEEMIEKDLKIRSAYRTRTKTLLGTAWEIVAAPARIGEEELAEEIAVNVRRWIEGANLREMRKHQLDAIGKPFAVSWINWQYVTEDGTLRVVPHSFTPMAGRRFRWNNAATFGKNADPTDQLRYFEDINDQKGEALKPYTTIRTLFNDQSDHPTRAGLLRGFLFPYAFKVTSLKDWISYVDKNGTPIRVITIAKEDFTPGPTFELIKASIRDLGSNAHGVFPNDATIQIHAPVGDVRVFKETCDYLDKAFAQAILGHELSSQASPGEGNLGISAAEKVRQDVLEGDAEDYAPMEQRDLYRPLVGFNYGWDVIHLTPTLKFKTEPPRDTTAWTNNVTTFARTFDIAISRRQSYKELGLDVPAGIDVGAENDAMYARPAAPSPFGTPGAARLGNPPDDEEDEDLEQEGDDGVDDGDAKGPRALAASGERGEGVSEVKLKPSQRTVDRIANRAISGAEAELLAMRRPIERLVKRAEKEGWSHRELLEGVTALFARIPLTKTERLAAQSRTMARLFGRTARAK